MAFALVSTLLAALATATVLIVAFVVFGRSL
jgi:hypothetical protein